MHEILGPEISISKVRKVTTVTSWDGKEIVFESKYGTNRPPLGKERVDPFTTIEPIPGPAETVRPVMNGHVMT